MTLRTHVWSGGQTLPLFAIMVPGMLALMALGIDSAQIFLERRETQGAADLAALAGAQFIHDGATSIEQAQAESAAISLAVANGYQASQVTATTPYDGDDEKIHVIIDSSVDTFFMPILDIFAPGGYETMPVGAEAVAYGGYEVAGGGDFAIFALEGCPSSSKTVDISGSNVDIIGRVHSNSDVNVGGSSNTFTGSATDTCGSSEWKTSDNTYDPAPARAPSPEPDPTALTRADFTCTYTATGSGMWDLTSNGSWWVGGTKTSKTLKAGTYCSGTGSSDGIKLSDSNIVIEDIVSGPGGVTFIGQAFVEISGSNFTLRPHEHNVLFFSYGTSDVAIKVSGSGGSWEGIIYAPRGTAEVSGSSNLAITGGIVAKRVKLNGSGMSIDGTAGAGEPGEQTIALIE